GKEKIAFQNYFYNFKEKRGTRLYWRCNNKKCSSYLYTNVLYCLLEYTSHNHTNNEVASKNIILKSKIKERALVESSSARNVILDSIENGFIGLPFNYVHARKTVVSFRNKNNFTYIGNYDIPIEITKTRKGDQFLHFDSGPSDPERILIFTTEENLRHVGLNSTWLCDATFKCVPVNFEQLFIIQCLIREKYLPLVFVFMKKKNTSSYKKIFFFLSEKGIKQPPKAFVIDFEQAIYSAIREIYPEACLYGCLFHLGQILWRRVQSHGFSTKFINEFQFKTNVKMILCLAFVPETKVELFRAGLQQYFVSSRFKDEIVVLEWFTKHYFQNDNRTNKHILFWNAYERTKSNIPRTTNSLEGYNRHINSLILGKMGSIRDIGREILNEQVLTENWFLYSLYDKIKVKTKDSEKLINGLNEIDNLSVVDYLKKISFLYNMVFN
ncbi:hypothetical protein CDIK_2353, partial [Cucumispora dikerogammari]